MGKADSESGGKETGKGLGVAKEPVSSVTPDQPRPLPGVWAAAFLGLRIQVPEVLLSLLILGKQHSCCRHQHIHAHSS